jgi:signal peptidase II
MQATGRKGLALTDGRSHGRLWLTVGAGLAADLATKAAAWRFLGPPPDGGTPGAVRPLVPGLLQLVTSRNPGIVFGFDFARDLGLGEAWGRAATIALTVLTALLVFWVFAGARPDRRWLHVMCGLVLAGALGNLYDRLLFGYVRDFVQITLHVRGAAVWPYVFNLADVYLVVGVAMLALGCLVGGPRGAAGERGVRPTERKNGGR